jgi:hypothetical protein
VTEAKPSDDRQRALCCECGNLRTVSTRFSFPRDENKTYDDGCHPGGWRATGTLKCPVCKQKTRHARLREPSEFRDIAESRMTGCPGCGAPEGESCRDFMGHPLGRKCNSWLARQ